MQSTVNLFSRIQLLKSRILRAIQTRLTTPPPRLPIRIRATLDNLAAEENDSSVVADGNGDVLTNSYQYLYIAYPQLPVGVDQVIAFATPNDSDVLHRCDS